MKKGFSLIELIAVIALLGIIMTLTSISVIHLKRNSDQKLYNEKVHYIEVGATKWGEDHLNLLSSDTCNNVLVSALINSGYISGDSDDNTKLLIPGTNNYFEGSVCVKYENIHSDISDLSSYASNYEYDDYTNYQVTSKYNTEGDE